MQDNVLDRGRLRARAHTWLATLTAVALAAGAIACGADDGDSDRAQSGTNAADSTGSDSDATKPLTGNDKQQIRQLLKNLQADYIKGDAVSYCSSLTAAGRKQVARVGRPYGLGDTCEDFISQTSAMARDTKVKQKPSVLLSVDVRGNRAVASVSDGGRLAQPLVFVKVDGEWKVPDPGIRDPLAPPKQAKAPGQDDTAQ